MKTIFLGVKPGRKLKKNQEYRKIPEEYQKKTASPPANSTAQTPARINARSQLILFSIILVYLYWIISLLLTFLSWVNP
jgi:hypothetical protein